MSYPELKYLFIQPEFENIGLEYLSAVLKKEGHTVELLFIPRPFSNTAFNLFRESEALENQAIENAIRLYQPDIVGFSPFTSYFRWAVKKANFIKALSPDIFILFGGVHATLIPESTILENSIDALLIGEAETAILDFSNNFHDREKRTTSSNMWLKQENRLYKNPLTPLIDLDTLPYPDKALFLDHFPAFHKKDTFTFMSGRGCPYRCTYCCNSAYNALYDKQKVVRFQSPEYVIEQLLFFKHKYDFNRVDFMDDVFAINRSRLEILLPLFAQKLGIPFVAFLYPNKITASRETIKLLKETGCSWLKIGVQSANEEYRRQILCRHEKNEMIIKIADLCNEYGLSFSFDHIFQLPGESKHDLIEAVTLYNRCRPRIINFGNLIYLPKTPIVEHGLNIGELTPSEVEQINQGNDLQALSSNIKRFQSDSPKQNYSIIVFLFTMITLVPQKIVDVLLKKRVYDLSIKLPSVLLILLKLMSKCKAGQGYVYLSAMKYSWYYGIYEKLRRRSN